MNKFILDDLYYLSYSIDIMKNRKYVKVTMLPWNEDASDVRGFELYITKHITSYELDGQIEFNKIKDFSLFGSYLLFEFQSVSDFNRFVMENI